MSFLQLDGLKDRVGIEGFLCIVKSDPEFVLEAKWWFSSPDLETYLNSTVNGRWDSIHISHKVEQFATKGGCMIGECSTGIFHGCTALLTE